MTAALTARRYYVLWRSISIWGQNNSTKSAADTLGRLALMGHTPHSSPCPHTQPAHLALTFLAQPLLALNI
jgi:hypothetical protein